MSGGGVWKAATCLLTAALVVGFVYTFHGGDGRGPEIVRLHRATDLAAGGCPRLEPQVVVYNRIPKAGSSTMLDMLAKLAKQNDFSLILPTPFYNHTALREAIFAAVSSGQRVMLCNHFNFPEVLYGDIVAYINVMRQPVDRCASVYYYFRYGERQRVLKNEVLARYGNSTLDECCSRPFDELDSCLNCPQDEQAQAFCGREGGECAAVSSNEVLRRAWANLKAHFVVGITEDMPGTVQLFEWVLPSFFRGAGPLLSATTPKRVSSRREEYQAPGEAARAVVAEWAAVDMELYDRVASRFRQLHAQCRAQR